MKPPKILISITAAVCLLFFDVPGYSFEYRLGAEIFEGLFKEDNYLDEATATFDYDETYNIFGIYPEGVVEFGGNISGYAFGELEWFHSWDAEDSDDLDGKLADLFLSYSASGFSADVGLQPFLVGRGMVFYSDEPGVALRYDISKNTYIKGDAFKVFDNSPMAKITLGYCPGFLESVEIIGAGYYDSDDRIAELYEPFYENANLESSGHLFWVGGQADYFIQGVFVSCLILHQFGSVEIDAGSGAYDLDVSAYLFNIDMNYNISRQLSAGAFVFSASGDHSPESGSLHAFMSPMPFNQTTSIFFNGGFKRYDIDEAVRLGGVTWDGVIAPGVKLEYQPNPKIIAELVGATMFPQGDLFNRDVWYGWETDTRLSYEFYPGKHLFAEGGMFWHGNYFNQKYGYRPDPATRFVAGMSLIF